MQLSINGINYQLSFGLGFLRQINSLHPTEVEGFKVPYGSLGVVVNSASADPSALADLVEAAIPEAQRPTNADLESWLDELIGAGQYTKTVETIAEEVLKSNTLKFAMGMAQKAQEPQNQQVQQAVQAVQTTDGPTAIA